MSVRPLSFASLLLSVIVATSAAAAPVEGRDYTRLSTPQRSDTPGKVEVIEFFSYGCPHCADVNPQLKPWEGKLPADAVFKRVPVGFGRPAWQSLARAYYALEATGDLERLDQPLFDAIHKQRLPLQDERSIAAWVGKQGGNAAAFSAAFKSFAVVNKTARAEELTRRYQIMQVPTFAVDGRYIVLGDSHEAVLGNASALVTQTQRNASR
ncbi:MAG TPA: thiol:disulfide interchange protein DsbA/DsbL [Steroidobacteraceae bacterium]|nr:thiol:disulfide interchange protein DsbA/DsbL [Steroidobacteraceae bacterium]